MRILILSCLFMSAFYYFLPKRASLSEIDAVKFKMSSSSRRVEYSDFHSPALQKDRKATQARPSRRLVQTQKIQHEASTDRRFEHRRNRGQVIEHEANEGPKLVSDLDELWYEELARVLEQELQLDGAREIHEAAVGERENYKVQLDALVREHRNNQELEYMIEELGFAHEERLKKIYGRYYEDIKDYSTRYYESLRAEAEQAQISSGQSEYSSY